MTRKRSGAWYCFYSVCSCLPLLTSGCTLHFHYHAPVKVQSDENRLLDELLEDLNDANPEESPVDN